MPGCSANFIYIPVKIIAQIPMLSAHLAINPEVQGQNLAVNILSFVTNFFHGERQRHDRVQHAPAHMWEHQRCNRMEHASNLHVGQVHSLVWY